MPLFSLVIFTKNRPQLAAYALTSVLRQSFTDFEVIVSDNDDTDATSNALKAFRDPRIVYHRTSGKLSMADNWEEGLSLARGQFVLSLTDRCVLKSYALATIHKAITQFRQDVYVWRHDILESTFDYFYYGSNSTPVVTDSRDLFDLFLTSEYGVYEQSLPRGLNSCCAQSVLTDIKARTGRVFHPVSPDYTLAFLTLAMRRQVVCLNQSLFLWGYGRLSNGYGSSARSETFNRFLSDAGLKESDLMRHVPLKLLVVHNAICNDLLSLKAQYPDLFEDVNLWLVPYFVTCRKEIDTRLKGDPGAVQQWAETVAKFPQLEVAVYTALTNPPEPDDLPRRILRSVSNSRVARRLREHKNNSKQPSRRFSNILEAVAWVETSEGMH